MVILEYVNLEWYRGCNQIIVLIVLIVTQCLNEAMPFSLFNAAQILGILIRGTPAVVFIVLIVLIVTRGLNEAMSFSLCGTTQILGIFIMDKTMSYSLTLRKCRFYESFDHIGRRTVFDFDDFHFLRGLWGVLR